MFESTVTGLLNKYLAPYLDGVDPKQLKIGVFAGDIVLKNCSLKTALLDELDLPFSVKAGYVGNITLKIPWRKLFPKVIAPLE